MHAAVVTSFDAPPRYQEFPDPVAARKGEAVVEVLAAGLHPRVRSQANGSHYTSAGTLPLVPGIDAVVRDSHGKIRYVVMDDTDLGTLAQRTVIELDRSVVLPTGTDPVLLAAAMNPVMSSWLALRRRIRFRRGQSVLIHGATGNAGRLAVEVAHRLHAGRVVAVGRDQTRLAGLRGVEVGLAHAADVDVVLDYVWGEPTAKALVEIVTARADRGRPLTWVQLGSVAGLTAPIPSAALRAARLEIVGSGIGSVPGRDIIAEIPRIAKAVAAGGFDVRARAVPLAEVESVWSTPTTDRVVLVP